MKIASMLIFFGVFIPSHTTAFPSLTLKGFSAIIFSHHRRRSFNLLTISFLLSPTAAHARTGQPLEK
jgi:uncharacterized membrane protein YfcA